jgi:SAM-dependent methyltransferase
MASQADMLNYYGARAYEYEKVYAKPERQADLLQLHELVPAWFAGRHVLEVACGTGYWTRRIVGRAASITGCDLAPEVLALAQSHQPATSPAAFVLADAFALDGVPGAFDASFVGFWWSHIPRADLPRFLGGLDRRLPAGSRVLILDNRYVEGSNWPITRVDDDGNTYQRRVLESGAEHEVLKNFPAPDELRDAIASSGGAEIAICELQYYWYAT